ncbi:Protein rogdi -like protein [Trichinella pseudospiralis]|uniref:Protein rogdi-like protein n=1 Tax=Trichinella pseudospiralis TaxID=6337 RepID=A0A0V1KBQ8_TRIPS|nr:Protein rogdi -like protein [Trichinella pseudospiralis]KRZ44341.1 Protein rogdi -like protein [Trichinella pseudospiralis]
MRLLIGMASRGEYEKQEVKQSFYLYEEAVSTLRKVEILLRECCTKLPNRNQFNENCSSFAPEKYVLADSGENLKCVVTIIGDNVAKAEVAVRYPKMPSHFYRAVVQPDIQWKIQQIQDFGNFVLGAFEQIQIGLAASGESANEVVEKKILNNINDIFQSLLSARNSLTCIQKKSQTCKMRDNLLRKCFVPLPPADLTFDLYISSSKLVFSVITTPVQASEKDPIQIYECECFIPWLYDLTIPVSHALQVMQTFLEKIAAK